MLKKKKQHKYLSKRWHAIRCYLSEFGCSSNPEVLHKLRVEIKKVRAFVRFSAAGAAESNAAMKAVRKIFRKAGEIRETALTLALMKKYGITDASLEAEKNNFLQQKSALFRSHITGYDRRVRKAAGMLGKDLQPLRNGNVKKWFVRQLRKTGTLTAAPLPNLLHEARKKIKTMLYVHAFLPKRLAQQLQVNSDYLHQLQENIGNWHDVAMALSLFPPREKKENVKTGRLHREQAKQERRIAADVKDFLQKASHSPGE